MGNNNTILIERIDVKYLDRCPALSNTHTHTPRITENVLYSMELIEAMLPPAADYLCLTSEEGWYWQIFCLFVKDGTGLSVSMKIRKRRSEVFLIAAQRTFIWL